MKYLILALSLLVASAQAATSISTTLTMTSPSAVISMTGISSTLIVRNISSTTISTTALALGGRSFDRAVPCAAFTYDMSGQVTRASTTLITSINRRTTGYIDVSGTFPSTPWPICSAGQAPGALTLYEQGGSNYNVSPSTAGFVVTTYNTSGGSVNSPALSCFVYCQ